MTELFNGANAPMTDAWYGLLALPPIIWFLYRKIAGRPAGYWIPATAFTLGVLVVGTTVWDVARVRYMLRTGDGLHTTRGSITNRWTTTSRQRDFTKTSLAYKTSISEGFDIGVERFAWTVGGGYTAATFSNLGAPRVLLQRGTEIEVTWFADEAENGVRRIVKLSLRKMSNKAIPLPAVRAAAAQPTKASRLGDFSMFQNEFVRAIKAGDQARAKALTRLPFLFGGNQIEAGGFGDLWNALQAPQTVGCLAQAKSVAESDGGRSIFCGEIILVFRVNPSGAWRFVEVGADD